MKSWNLVCLSLCALLILTGCAITPKLKTDVPSLFVSQKLPIKVSLLVTESSYKITKPEELPSSCWGGLKFPPLKFGELFEGTVKGTFSQIFDEVHLVKTPEPQENSQVVLEADLTSIAYKPACGFSPKEYYISKGTLRLLDKEGKELWRSNRNSYRSPDYGLYMGFSMAEFESLMGQRMSAVMSSLVKDWAQELMTQPDIRRMAGEIDTPSQKKEKLQAKPSIFVAYPKGGEEVLEEKIELLGYITSLNRAETLTLLVNNHPFPLEELWADLKINYQGLRGFPLRLNIPLKKGRNKINLFLKDQAGFLVNHTVIVNKIELVEAASVVQPEPEGHPQLPSRLDNIPEEMHSMSVTQDNFMEVLSGWVKQTAFSDYNKGNSMFDQGRYERSAYYYKKSIKTDPFSQAYFNLGLSQKILGNTKDAQNAFSKACEMEESKGCEMAK